MKRLTATLLLAALAAPATAAEPGLSDWSQAQLSRMAEVFARAHADGQAWARILPALEALYRERRARGESNREAVHNLRRIALPGQDIAEYGEAGQRIRRELDALTQDARRRDGLGESAAVAATALHLHEVLQRLVAIEVPRTVHFAVAEPGGSAQWRRSQDLFDGAQRRTVTAFTETVGASREQQCTLDTLTLGPEVHVTLTCRPRGPASTPMASTTSQCATIDDRLKALRLVLQTDEASTPHEVFAWCSFEPR